jgi:hypothetical protein
MIGRSVGPARDRDGSTESDASNALILVGCSFATGPSRMLHGFSFWQRTSLKPPSCFLQTPAPNPKTAWLAQLRGGCPHIPRDTPDEAGQTILHCHLHLIPRRKGDIDDPRGGVRGVIPDKRVYQ